MSKQKTDRYERLNARYGEKYNLDGKSIGHIRSAAITDKKTKEDIAAHCQELINRNQATIAKLTADLERYTKTRIWLENCSDEDFKDLTNPKPPKLEGEANGK